MKNLFKLKQFNSDEINIAQEISNKFNLELELAKILISRGLTKEDEINKFLNVSLDDFYNPFLLSGMSDAVNRINLARDNNEKIVVFGDYDADGICATTVLCKFLKDYGLDVSAFIPNREDGYGLSEKTVEFVAENFEPDLLITVDTGISCKNEVEYLFDLGIDVIVTDHHELPELLPDCVCVNPKKDRGNYPFCDLCGAGVALKLTQALSGGNCNEYLDIVAVATVADNVPLKDENRLIVKYGLDLLNSNPNKSIKLLAETAKMSLPFTATNLAFTIVPRINAVGRMGDASRALNFFLADDDIEIKAFATALCEENKNRQASCDKIFLEACKMIDKEKPMNAVFVCSKDWDLGILGIIASKLVERYERPAFVFSELDGKLKGSSRSLGNIDLHNLLSKNSDLFVSFGGHFYACGMTVEKQNYEEFKLRIDEFLQHNYRFSDYFKETQCDFLVSDAVDVSFVEKLSSFEPYGISNPAPTFLLECQSIRCSTSAKGNHLFGQAKGNSFVFFRGGEFKSIFESNVTKQITMQFELSEYKGKVSPKAIVDSVNVLGNADETNSDDEYCDFLVSYDFAYNGVNLEELTSKIQERKFGVAIVIFNKDNYDKIVKNINLDAVLEQNYYINSYLSSVIFKPKNLDYLKNFDYIVSDYDLKGFDSKPIDRHFVSYDRLRALNLDRKVIALYYKIIIESLKIATDFKTLSQIVFKKYSDIDKTLLAFCFAIFKELGIIVEDNKHLSINTSKKVDLSDSFLYDTVLNKSF